MSITVSQGFKDNLNPRQNLKADLDKLFQEGELALFLMNTKPPTDDELILGMQTYDVTDFGDDTQLITSLRNSMRECTAVVPLNPADWKSSAFRLAELTGGSVTEDPHDLLSLVPSNDGRFNNAQCSTDWKRHRQTYLDRPFQWALLGRKSDSIMSRTWFKMISSTTQPILNGSKARVLDFRGMVPLSVGVEGSTANIWLKGVTNDSKEGYVYQSGRYWTKFYFTDHVDIGRIQFNHDNGGA